MSATNPRLPVRGVFKWMGNVLTWILLLVVLAVAVAAIGVPRFAGASPYAVLSSSMEPRYPPGTLLIVRPMPAERLAIGDVITYQLRSRDPAVVTHRIIAVTYSADGQYAFRTKGDHNNTADPDPVREAQIRGELWYAVPFVGWLTMWSGFSTRIVIIGAVTVGLVGYAAALIVSAVRDRHRTRKGPRPAVAP